MKEEIRQFSFTEEEAALIAAALTTPKPWEEKSTKSIRDRIHSFHKKLTDEMCCYCQANMHGQFKLVIDPEHVLPSSIYKELTYTVWNLSVACKRCNMMIKKARTDFINHSHTDKKHSNHYLFIHPNFDNFEDHLEITTAQKGKRRLVKYIIYSETKGRYTFNYFKLNELEINNFDRSQGIKTAPLSSEVASVVKELAKIHGI